MDFFRQLFIGISDAWKQLSMSARINIVLAGLLVAALVGYVAYSSARPAYVTLSSHLDATEANQIVSILSENRIPYQHRDGYATIQVAGHHLSNAQLLLAEANLPVGRGKLPGFELFDQTQFLTSQSLQDIKFMRAIQGELQRQLNLFDFVDFSYVHIREARQELFAAEQLPSQAAVTLKLNRRLSAREIQGIVNIVASAGGANLNANNVTVATTDGEILHAPREEGFAVLAGNKLEYITALESQREAKLRQKLEEIGVRATVSVSARVQFDEVETTSRQVTEGSELSTYNITTNISSVDRLPEGAPGALANVPEGMVTPGGTEMLEETLEEIINYEPSYTLTTTRTDPGDVAKYNVSMIIEGEYVDGVDEDGNPTREYVGLSETRREAFIALARASVGEGLEETEVTIHDHPFDVARLTVTTQVMDEVAAERQREWLLQTGWTVVQILGILIGFFFVRRFLKRAIEHPKEVAEEETWETPSASAEDLRRQDVAMELARLSSQEPESIAALLRTWLVDEEED